jgi:two-component system cell cycle sensor histidine kinase/response regulator CckA
MTSLLMPCGCDADLLIQAQELVHVGTWTWDVAGDVVWWSDEMFRLLELEPQSIPLGLSTYLSFVHPDDRARVEQTIAESLASKRSMQFDSRVITTTGRVMHALSRGSVLCDGAGTVTRMLGTCIDISDRVLEQQAMRDSEERFRSIFEQSAIGLAIADSHGKLVQVNASLARFLDYEPTELYGTALIDATHPDDREVKRAMMREHETSRASFTYETRFLRRNGDVVWGRSTITRLHRDDGTVNGFMAVIEDITEPRRASGVLKRQTELVQTIMDNLPVMVSLFDRDGKPLYVNKEWEKVFGWTLDEARTTDLLPVAFPDPAVAERVRRLVADGTPQWTELDPMARNGRRIPSLWACLRLSDGTSLTIGQDMTERRQMQQRLVQSQKMEALGQLAGGVAHDFNNLLTIINACATFVLESHELNAESTNDINEIVGASNRAAALTRQLLAFSRRQMLKLEIIDVNASIQEIARTLHRLIGEHIQLAVVPTAANAAVETDAHQFEQVLLNLAVNARDAVGDQGTITIETKNARVPSDDGRLVEHLVISVTDDGCGIDPSIRDHLFEPFFTTKAIGKGTGLGLATVHGIVQHCGGRIEVESELGKGSTFHVMLPVASARDAEATVGAGPESLAGCETVLLVEDEAALRAVTRRILCGLGYKVLEARHGGDAVQISERYAGPIHLLITDVVMPVLGGRELARKIRSRRPDIPILFVSGYTDDELFRKGTLEPGAQLLRKPFLSSELARSARQLLRSSAE